MIKVTALKDESGHWYLVPSELRYDFIILLDRCTIEDSSIQYEYEREFIHKFSKYMIGGDINNIQLYIEDNEN